MNNDFYAECLVSRAAAGTDTVKKIFLCAGAALIAVAAFWFLLPISPLIIGGVFYGAYYLLTGIDTEYEYILTNGDLDVDKISGKRSRKRLVSAKISEFTAFGRYEDAPEAKGSVTTVLVSDGTGKNDYFADFVHKSEGNVRIIFTPNEKLLEGIGMYLPRTLKAEFNRNKARQGKDSRGNGE